MKEHKLEISEHFIFSMEAFLRSACHMDSESLRGKRFQIDRRRFCHEDLKGPAFQEFRCIERFPLEQIRVKSELVYQGFVLLVRDYKGHVLPYIAPQLICYFSREQAISMLIEERYESIMYEILKQPFSLPSLPPMEQTSRQRSTKYAAYQKQKEKRNHYDKYERK